MASNFDRNAAKQEIKIKQQSDGDLSDKLTQAHIIQMDLTRLQNDHKLKTMRTEQGYLGKIFGSWNNVPMLTALLSVVFGLFAFTFCMYIAIDAENKDFWSEYAKASLAFSGAALGYIFGRGNSSN